MLNFWKMTQKKYFQRAAELTPLDSALATLFKSRNYIDVAIKEVAKVLSTPSDNSKTDYLEWPWEGFDSYYK